MCGTEHGKKKLMRKIFKKMIRKLGNQLNMVQESRKFKDNCDYIFEPSGHPGETGTLSNLFSSKTYDQ